MSFRDQNGLLTESHRRFLRGETSTDNEAVYRKRIRDRLRRSLVDFSLLFYYLDHEDWYSALWDEAPDNAIRHLGHDAEDGSAEIPELVWDVIPIEGAYLQRAHLENQPVPHEDLDIGDEEYLMTGGMRHAHACMYYALLRGLQHEFGIPLEYLVEQLVEESLQDTYGKMGRVASVDVDVDVEFEDVDVVELQEKLEEGTISEQELEWLIHVRAITPREVSEQLTSS